MITLLISLFLAKPTKSTLTYTRDARPVLERRCAQCHNQRWPGYNWLNYDDAYAKRDKIKLRVKNFSMPPAQTMPKAERDTLIEWIEQGAKK